MSSQGFIVYAQSDTTGHSIPLYLKSEPRDSGVIVNQQNGAWARAFSVEFEGRDSDTKAEMRRIRRENGWRSDSYRLRVKSARTGIAFRGVNKDALPDGKYRVKLHIDGYRTRKWLRVDLEGSEEIERRIALTLEEQRRVQVDMRRCDRGIKRLLEDSEIDHENVSAVSWLSSPVTRPSQRHNATLIPTLKASAELSRGYRKKRRWHKCGTMGIFG